MMTDLMMSSWETIARRSLLIAQNQCSPLEYHLMISEKALAAMETGYKFIAAGGQPAIASLITPWLERSKANSRRLRKRR